MEQIGSILDQTSVDKKINTVDSQTVNSNKKDNKSTVNSNTVNSSDEMSKKINTFLENEGITIEGVAKALAEGLGDIKSMGYYLVLSRESSLGKLLQALSITKDAATRGMIKTKKAIYFQGILKRWGIKTQFKTKHQ